MTPTRRHLIMPLMVVLLGSRLLPGTAHQAPCHRRHSCPSDHSAPIAKTWLDAHTRGVQVQVLLDKSQRMEKYSSANFLANQGVPTMIDADHAMAHNKVIIIDGEMVITGPFNFTKSAQEKHAENVLIIRGPALAAQYTKNWASHRQHSQPYAGRGVR